MAKPWRDAQWPSVGRIVHVKGPNGECRAAVILRTWGAGPDVPVELHVFPMSLLSDPVHSIAWARDEWHWPEYVGPQAET